jgi:hypothetical protein
VGGHRLRQRIDRRHCDVVRDWAARFPAHLHLTDASERRSISHARNAGVAASNGVVLAFCDSDDIVTPGWLSAAAVALEQHGVVAGLNRELTDPPRADARILNPGCLRGRGIQSCNFAVRRDVFCDLGGFDESLPAYGCEDSEFSMRILAAGLTIGAAPTMELFFRPTMSASRRLSKVYQSAVAESVMMARHPEAYPGRQSTISFVTRLLAFPGDLVTQVRHGQRRSREAVARDLVTRVGNLVGHLTWVKTGRMGAPKLYGGI